jgi:hypothetical protein
MVCTNLECLNSRPAAHEPCLLVTASLRATLICHGLYEINQVMTVTFVSALLYNRDFHPSAINLVEQKAKYVLLPS